MKTKIEAVANVTVIVVALAVGFVVLKAKLASPRTPRSVAVGDRLTRSGHARPKPLSKLT